MKRTAKTLESLNKPSKIELIFAKDTPLKQVRHLKKVGNMFISNSALDNTVVKFESYGNYSSNNYGVNALVFTDINRIKYYFSYETLVAFEHPTSELVIRENIWGNTTGKHLNWIDRDKSKRVNTETFNEKLQELKSKLIINVPTL